MVERTHRLPELRGLTPVRGQMKRWPKPGWTTTNSAPSLGGNWRRPSRKSGLREDRGGKGETVAVEGRKGMKGGSKPAT